MHSILRTSGPSSDGILLIPRLSNRCEAFDEEFNNAQSRSTNAKKKPKILLCGKFTHHRKRPKDYKTEVPHRIITVKVSVNLETILMMQELQPLDAMLRTNFLLWLSGDALDQTMRGHQLDTLAIPIFCGRSIKTNFTVRPSSTVQSLLPVHEQTKRPFFRQLSSSAVWFARKLGMFCSLLPRHQDSLDSAANTTPPCTIETFVPQLLHSRKVIKSSTLLALAKPMHTSDSHLTWTLPTHRQQMLSDFALPSHECSNNESCPRFCNGVTFFRRPPAEYNNVAKTISPD